MNVVSLRTKDRQLKIEEPIPIITSGSVNCDEIQVSFDETWDVQTDLFACFFNNIDITEYAMPLELVDGVYKCLIPPEAIAEPCFLKIGVYSVKDGKTIKTSGLKRFEVYQGAKTDGIEPYTETLKKENAELAAKLEAVGTPKEEQEKSVDITENGTTEVTPDDGKALSKVTVNVDVPDPSEELENLIDQSGVLDSTEGTVEEKVEQLIDRTDLFIKQSAINFVGNEEITDIDFYIETPYRSYDSAFESTTNLKHIVGINTSKSTNNRRIFAGSGVEIIDMPFDFSAQPSSSNFSPFDGAYKIVEVRVKANSYRWTSSIHSAVLSDDSIQSIVDGLATVSTSQSIRFNSAVIAKLTDKQKATISNKGWTLVQL